MSNGCMAIHRTIPTWAFVKSPWGIRLNNSNVLQNVNDRGPVSPGGQEGGDDDDDVRHHEFTLSRSLVTQLAAIGL